MAKYKRDIDKKPDSPDIVNINDLAAFATPDGKTLKVASSVPISILEKLGKGYVAVTDSSGTISTSAITHAQLNNIKELTTSLAEFVTNLQSNTPALYPVLAQYNANAAPGRYLEIFSGIDSLIAPIIIPTVSTVATITVGTSNTAGDFEVGIFKSTDLVVPIASVLLLDTLDRTTVTGLSVPVAALSQLSVKVIVGTRSKPFLSFYINTTAN